MNSIPLPPPRWLSFDCYGTLIDWQGGVVCAFRDLLPSGAEDVPDIFSLWEGIQREMLREPYAPYAEIMRNSFRQTMESLGHRCPPYATESFVESLARWEPFPDVNPALIRLSQQYKLAVISNIDRQLLGGTLRRLPVRFDAIMTAEDARTYKPDPAIFELALRKIGCAPQEVAHVAFGADYDLEPACGLGIRAVYLNRQGLPRPALPLEAEIRSLADLPRVWVERSVERRAAASGSILGGANP
jgi:2-haloalkanoic acid dehalogenase type II